MPIGRAPTAEQVADQELRARLAAACFNGDGGRRGETGYDAEDGTAFTSGPTLAECKRKFAASPGSDRCARATGLTTRPRTVG